MAKPISEARQFASDVKEIKNNLLFKKQSRGCSIVAVAISRNDEDNDLLLISYKKGEPITSFIFDVTKDGYYVSGIDYIEVCEIPFSFTMTMEGSHGWEITIPVPESIFVRYLSSKEMDLLESWKMLHAENTEIQYLQILNAY